MPRSECVTCGKTFAREAHLERHQESHRSSPRWSCPYCGSSYTRRDALNRHLSRCTAAASDTRVPSARINRACQACSERKVRCSRDQPCQRCVKLNVPCRYLVHGAARQPRTAPPPLPDIFSASEIGASNTSNGDDPAVSATLAQPHASVAADYQQCFSDPGDTNPWLWWEWIDSPWNVFDSVPSMLTDISNDRAIEDRSYGMDTFCNSSSNTRTRVESIIDAKIDPVEHHRQSILTFVQKSPDSVKRDENWQWLVRDQFPHLLKTYFTRHHRHTPIIHLPTFDIGACPTSLIFALALIAASYIPSLGVRAKNIVVIAKCAYQLAVESDEGLRNGGAASLETLQALVLLSVLDRLMVKRTPGSPSSINLGEIARFARAARIFDVPSDPPNVSWRNWAVTESRRRLGLVLFAFDAFISVLHDETPRVRADELNLRFPSPEFMFMAASEAEWRDADRLHTHDTTATYPVSLTLSSLFCNLDQPAPLPNTLMGRFVVLHGILQHAWRSKRVLLENAIILSDPALGPYLRSKASAIHNSLRKWREGWPENLVDFELFPECPSLYQDRAEACWYLAGIVVLPHVAIALPKAPMTDPPGVLSIQQTLERLMVLSDQDRLHSVGQDFDATYRLVAGQDPANVGNGALGGLIYREADTTRAGFEE